MSWVTLFSLVNLMAMVAWACLILLPRWPALLAACLYLGVGLLCLIYAVGLGGILGGVFDPAGPAGNAPDFSSIAGVQAIFASQGGTVIGWTHYLAFDLFIGIWIARDADAKGFSRIVQAPILLATFMAGPLGLLVWLVVRERSARKSGRWS